MTNMSVPTNLFEELWMSSTHGIPEGQTLHVPLGRCALIVHEAEILYVLTPASYLLTRAAFPNLRALRVKQGTQPMLRGTIYLIRTDDVVVSWNQPIVAKSRWNEGAAFESVKGRYGVRITNPPQFFQSVYRRLYAAASEQGGMQSFRLAQPGKDATRLTLTHLVAEANRFASPLLDSALETIQNNRRRQKVSLVLQPAAIQNEIGSLIAPQLNACGAQLFFFAVDSVSSPAPMPCSCCGNDTRHTGYASFGANASLLVVRYTWTRSGYFCALCALKYFLGYTGIILVAGWWGLIGLIMSPILIALNLVNIGRVLLRYRDPVLPAVPAQGNAPRLH